MFVIDRDALKPVDILYFIYQIECQFLDTLDRQNIMRRRVTVEQIFALFDPVAILDTQMLSFGNKIFSRFGILLIRNDRDTALVLVVAAKFHRTGNLGYNRMVFGPPGLEQLCNARQAAGNIACFCTFQRNTSNDVTRFYLLAGID